MSDSASTLPGLTPEDPEGFAMIPRWLQRDPNVSAHAKLVFLALSSRSGRGGVRVRQELIATECGVSVRTVQKALRELEALGAVEAVEQRRQDGGRGANTYRLLVDLTGREEGRPPAQDVRNPPAPAAQAPPQEVRSNNESLFLNESSSIEERASVRDPLEHFEAFWSAYPRHDDKARARKAWPRAVKAAGGADVILVGAVRYRDDPNREQAFTKHAATWLNAEAWANQPLPERGGPQRTQDVMDVVERARQRDAAAGQ